MGIGLGIVLVVIGLILVLGVVNFDISFVDDSALGWILLVVGILAIILALVINQQRSRTTHVGGAPLRRPRRPADVPHRNAEGAPRLSSRRPFVMLRGSAVGGRPALAAADGLRATVAGLTAATAAAGGAAAVAAAAARRGAAAAPVAAGAAAAAVAARRPRLAAVEPPGWPAGPGCPEVASASAVIGRGVVRESWCRRLDAGAGCIARTTSSTWRGVVIETTAPDSPARAVRPERCR